MPKKRQQTRLFFAAYAPHSHHCAPRKQDPGRSGCGRIFLLDSGGGPKRSRCRRGRRPFSLLSRTGAPEQRPRTAVHPAAGNRRAAFSATRGRLIRWAALAVCLFFLYFSVSASAAAIEAGKRGLSVCASVVIPSLFPFFVFSGLAVRCGLISAAGRAMAPVGRILFRAPACVTPVILMSMLSGSPVGASALTSLYESGAISKAECERFLPLCSLASPAFILGSVAALLQSTSLAVMLYILHVGSNMLLGFLYARTFPRVDKTTAKHAPATAAEAFSQSFVQALKGAVASILNVCGFVIIFCVIVSFLDISGIKGAFCSFGAWLIPAPDAYALCAGFFDGLFEMSSACAGISETSLSLMYKTALCAFSLSWLGLSIHFQIMSFTLRHGLRMGRYFLYKFVHALVSALLVFPCFLLAPGALTAFSPVLADSLPDGFFFPLMRFSFSCVLLLCILFLILAILNLYTNSAKTK